MKIAIIGAGMAALSCATALQAGGHVVAMFDKGRGACVRTATRRVKIPSGEVASDHGAQYLPARDRGFAAQVRRGEWADVVAAWPDSGADAWMESPAINSLSKSLCAPLTVCWNSRVDALREVDQKWVLDPVSQERFDALIIATPAEQAAPLLIAHEPAMAGMAQSCPSAPCWTAMLAFDERIAIANDIIRDAGIIGWAARHSAKPGRGRTETWVIQATAEWSSEHLEHSETDVVSGLLSALAAEATQELPEPIVRIGHRWRYSCVEPTHHGFLWNETMRIGAVGNWLIAPRIESASLSGRMLADRIFATHRAS
ncbi:NAD(P)/FAD-dependent oxidoreductase [Sphingomonas sp. PAMC 26621]|uniref:NAD(P)/FAD-dependent oxidoreductase n=1 Tax=Sphingomonas sp. PAMC 26621 TaxID=1112213 RepID=UPI000289C13F|nr:NAD(P)-binding protein [Sphingomonas sp. PAMC 26621]